MLPKTISLHVVVDSIIATLNARDPYTYEHSERVAFYAETLARDLLFPNDETEAIHIAAHLHDIGKIAVPDAILRKAGKLTNEEFEEMKRHPELGANIIKSIPGFTILAEIIQSHHERFDGMGYPEGLQGNEIHPGAQIIAVADTFDAITSRRSYRHAQTLDFAVREIREGKGTQFSPIVVESFNRVLPVFTEYLKQWKPARIS